MTQLVTSNFTDMSQFTPNTHDDATLGFDSTGTNLAEPHTLTFDCSDQYSAIDWTGGNDHYAEITFNATAADGVGIGSGVSCREILTAATYYRVVGNASGYEFGKMLAAAFTSLSSGSGTTFTANDILRLEIQGTTWRLKKNGTQFATGTDSSITTGNPGLSYSSSASSQANAAIKNFAAGDFSSGGGSGFSNSDRTSGGMVDMSGGMYCKPDRVLVPKAPRIFIPGMTRRVPRHPTLSLR